MSIDERELQANVDRMAKPIIRMIYHGSGFGIAILLLVMAVAIGLLSGEAALFIGGLLLVSVMMHGVWFGAQMTRLGIEQEERKKMLREAELYGEKEKAKRDRLMLSDDGELIDYPALEDEEEQGYYTSS